MIGQEVQCLVHSDRNKFRYGIIVSIAKETIIIKFPATKINKEEIVEYPKSYLGKELELINRQ